MTGDVTAHDFLVPYQALRYCLPSAHGLTDRAPTALYSINGYKVVHGEKEFSLIVEGHDLKSRRGAVIGPSVVKTLF